MEVKSSKSNIPDAPSLSVLAGDGSSSSCPILRGTRRAADDFFMLARVLVFVLKLGMVHESMVFSVTVKFDWQRRFGVSASGI